MKKFYSLFTLTLISGSLLAQRDSVYIDLEEVNLTNCRTGMQLNQQTGKSITVLDGKLFNRRAAMNIDDLLKFEAGVEVQQRGPAGSQADIIIRGSTFQQVLVLIDGIKLNDPLTGHFSGYIPIPPSEIERIEILKGPAAAIYGSEAVGGVINIITKTFFQTSRKKEEKFYINRAFGEYGLNQWQAGARVVRKAFTASAGLISNETQGQLLRGNNRGYFNNHALTLALNVPINDQWNISWRGSYDNRDFAAQNFYTPFASDTATEQVRAFWNQLRIKHETQGRTNQLDLMHKSTRDEFLFNPVSKPNENESDLTVVNFLHTNTRLTNLTLQYGAYLERRQIESNDRGNHQTDHAAVFANASWKIKQWNFNPGLRLVSDQNYGNDVLPQLNASYVTKNKRLVFRGGAGRAIRAADFTERFNNYNKTIVRGGNIGNPDLLAERSWNYEFGADFRYKKWKLSATGFMRDQSRVIDFVPTPYTAIPRNGNLDTSSRFKYAFAQNVKTVQTQGAELSISFMHRWAEDKSILINAAALLLDSKTSDSIPSFYILSHARFMLQNNVELRWKNWELSIQSLYKKRDASQAASINAIQGTDYFLVNARAQYHIGKIALYVAVQNVGNIQYSDLLGSRMPGRWTSAGFQANF
jgi:vitamin B12 transporter